MKSNDSAIRAIQELLQKKCLEEPAFALKLANPNRSMESAMNYLCGQIQKMGVCMVDDTTVMNLIIHYYDGDVEEDSIKPINCNIVVSKPELSDEDKAELREQAMKEYKEEQLRAIRRENQPSSTKSLCSAKNPKATATSNAKAQEINVEQGNLFGDEF